MANILTLSRFFLIVPFAMMFFASYSGAMIIALAIFVVASLTDFFDGWVARARGETSALGAALDPIADKALAAIAILLLTKNGIIRDASVVAGAIILFREILVSGLREALGGRGQQLPVTSLAKIKTAAQLIALTLFLATAPGGLTNEPLIRTIAEMTFWLAALLTLWTGAIYTRAAVSILRRD